MWRTWPADSEPEEATLRLSVPPQAAAQPDFAAAEASDSELESAIGNETATMRVNSDTSMTAATTPSLDAAAEPAVKAAIEGSPPQATRAQAGADFEADTSSLANAALRRALHNTTGTEAVAALEAWLSALRLAPHVTILDFSGTEMRQLEANRVLTIIGEGRFPSVTHLDLHGNALNASSAALAGAVAALPRLQHLSLAGTALGAAGAEVITAAVSALPASASLRHLNVAHSSIGSEGIAALGALLVASGPEARLGLRHLEELDVSGSAVQQHLSEDAGEPPGGVGVRSSFAALAAGLARAPRLRVLRAHSVCSPRPRRDPYWNEWCALDSSDEVCRMSACHDGLHGLLRVADISSTGSMGIMVTGTSIRAGAGAGAGAGPEPGNYLEAAGSERQPQPQPQRQRQPQQQQPQPQLEELDLGGNRLQAAHSVQLLRSLSEAVAPTRSLRVLRWGGNKLDSGAARDALMDVLLAAPGLTQLDLSSTGLGDTGALLMAHALLATSRGQLTQLGLRSTGIGPRGMAALELALAMHPNMTHLDLAGNPLGSDGASAVARALVGFPRLERLDLGHTHIGAEGLQALTAALQHVPRLRYLSLAWADAAGATSAAQEQALSSWLLFVPRLEHLHWYPPRGPVAGLAQALPHLQWLRSLALNGPHCEISDWHGKQAASLIAAVRRMRALRRLEMGDCVRSQGLSVFNALNSGGRHGDSSDLSHDVRPENVPSGSGWITLV